MKQLVQGAALLMIAGSMMGNQSCQSAQQNEARQLRRRVQVRAIYAPAIPTPNGGTFDFQSAANSQMYTVLQGSKYFSTATVDPAQVYNTAGLSNDMAAQFNSCDDGSASNKSQVRAKEINVNAACLIEAPQGVITGNIMDLTLTNGAGVSVGLTGLTQYLSSVGATFDWKQYTLAMNMQLTSPYEVGGVNVPGEGGRLLLGATTVSSYNNTYQGSISASFLIGLGMGISGYQGSPLSNTVLDGVTQGMNNLGKAWNAEADQPWYAMVMKNCDNYIYINAGGSNDANLQVGDIVRIKNVEYNWSGAACASDLEGSVEVTEVMGYARITQVGSTMSVAEVIKDDQANYPYSGDQIIHPGARVYMEKMYVPPTTTASTGSN